jgi:hypothetical protein
MASDRRSRRSPRESGRCRSRPSRKATVPEEADALRTEHERVRALHRRSAKLTEAARQLKLSFTTVRVMAANGDLELDPETDTSGARFVTRTSVEKYWIARGQGRGRRKSEPTPTVPFAEVLRFTGLGRRAAVDLIRSGALEEVPGMRSSCEVAVASLEAWLAEHRACEVGAGVAKDRTLCDGESEVEKAHADSGEQAFVGGEPHKGLHAG